jgi:hypothetical protein
MIRVVRTETRTGQLLVKVSLPRVDALIAEHPDRYTIPGSPDPAEPKPPKPRRSKWGDI